MVRVVNAPQPQLSQEGLYGNAMANRGMGVFSTPVSAQVRPPSVPAIIPNRRPPSLPIPRRGKTRLPVMKGPVPTISGPGLVPNRVRAMGVPPTDETPAETIPVEPRPTDQGIPTGKGILTRDEAMGFLAVLEQATKPVDEAVKDREDIECVRSLEAGPYPLAIKVRDRLRAELAMVPVRTEFPVSMGELTVAEKTVECAEAIGTIKTTRTVVAVGGGIGAAAVIFFLL